MTILYLDTDALARVRAMTERELQAEVRQLCKDRGLLVQHVEDSKAGRVWLSGFPDLEVIGPGGIIWRELKQQHKSATTEQLLVGAAIIKAGCSWKTWKPADLLAGRIAAELDLITERT